MSTFLAHVAVVDFDINLFSFGGLFVFSFAALTLLVHLVSAIAVYRDGHALRMRENAERPGAPGTILIPPEIWAIATLLMGVMVLAVYWFLHHSSIVARAGDAERRAFQPDVPPVG